MDASSLNVSSELRQLLLPVLQKKCLKNDQLWQNDILPQLISLFEDLGSSFTNSNDTDDATLSQIQAMVARITKRLSTCFSEMAPFTIHRLTELLLSPHESGYSSSSSKQTLKYLQAILRVVSVSSSESRYLRHQVVSQSPNVSLHKSQVSLEIYEQHDLPTNICFVPLDWDNKQTKREIDDDDDDVSGNGHKRRKSAALPTTEAIDFNGSSSATSANTPRRNSVEGNDAIDMSKLGSYNGSNTEDNTATSPLDDQQAEEPRNLPTDTEKLADVNSSNNYPVQLLSPLNTEKTVDKESASSTFEDGTMNYENPSKKHNEELLV